MSRPRVWTYAPSDYSGRLPRLGSDEWGRWTVVVPLPWTVVVVALWNSCDWRGHVMSACHGYCERCGYDPRSVSGGEES